MSRRLLEIFLLSSFTLFLAYPARAFEPVAARHGMVVAVEPFACEAGVEILKAGGNAVDAAVAVAAALAVTYPQAGNLGGGGFMLIRLVTGNSVVVDYREEAPGEASRNMYLDTRGELIPQASVVGARAVGVPGTVAGLALAEQKYGKLGWARVLEPAIRLAEQGFPVSYGLSRSLENESKLLSKFEESRHIFLRDGRYYEPGEVFKQPELAATLRQLARDGPESFYRGPIATALVAAMKEYGGLVTLADLERYRAKLRPPLVGHFRGYTILTVPLPSSGGVGLIEMLNVLAPLELGPPDSFQSMRLIVETMRRSYADRAAYLGDSDFLPVPSDGLTSLRYAATLRKEILESKPEVPVRAGNPSREEPSETTHFSAVDSEGNTVSNTYTLNGWFGSGVTVKGAGFLLNDEMDDFAAKAGAPNMFDLVQSDANAIAPHKRPLSSMTPTIVLEPVEAAETPARSRPAEGQAETPRRQDVRLVLGSPGGGTIINTVLQVLLNVLVYKMDVFRAVAAPRFHHQWMPDRLVVERWGFSADTLALLQQAGYRLEYRDSMGDCQAIEIDPRTGWRFGAADPRGEGKAAGY